MVDYVIMDKELNRVKLIKKEQSELSCECWTIQFLGLEACNGCEFLNTESCGGKNIRKTLKNKLGFDIPT